jgi:hypothetical protein
MKRASLLLLLLSGCTATQETIQKRQEALGEFSAQSNFAEAKQIAEIEEWKDSPRKIVMLYVNFPPGSENVIPLQCRGVPASSTESLEPNNGTPYKSSSAGAWLVPVDGVDVLTNEMAGRDGTFGDPVHFRQCLTVDGQYIDIPAQGVPYIVSSMPYTFAPNTIKQDTALRNKLKLIEDTLKRGQCISPETLEPIPCEK